MMDNYLITTGTIGCRDHMFSLDKPEVIEKESYTSENLGILTTGGVSASSYFTSNGSYPDPDLQAALLGRWGRNIENLELSLKYMTEVDHERHMEYFIIMISVADKAKIKSASENINNLDYSGIFIAYPGTCSIMDYYRPLVSKLFEINYRQFY